MTAQNLNTEAYLLPACDMSLFTMPPGYDAPGNH